MEDYNYFGRKQCINRIKFMIYLSTSVDLHFLIIGYFADQVSYRAHQLERKKTRITDISEEFAKIMNAWKSHSANRYALRKTICIHETEMDENP